MMDLAKYQGLIFDLDGTLVDTMPANLEAWRRTSEHYCFPFDAGWLYQLSGQPSVKMASAMIERYGLSHRPEDIASTKLETYLALDDHGEVIPCTYDLLVKYRDTKKTAIGTGGQRTNAISILESKDLLPLIDVVVTSSDVTNYKPAPDTFLLAAEKLGLAPEQCVVFEDTLLGIEAARNAGMDCILVKDGQLYVVDDHVVDSHVVDNNDSAT
ncbi:beta-phosphoglucomutase family hydrolase [Photobacterium alginatilyticum]